MLTIHPDLPRHVVAYTLDGTATAPDVRALTRAVEAATVRGHVHLMGEIGGLGGLTLDALRTVVRDGFGLIARVGRVDRYAVVTDTGWIAAAAKAQGALLPGVEVRTWPRAERPAALAWASEALSS